MVICKHRLETKPSASVAPHRELPEFHLDEPILTSLQRKDWSPSQALGPREMFQTQGKQEDMSFNHLGRWAERSVLYLNYIAHSGNLFLIHQWPRPILPLGHYIHADLKCVEGILEALPRKSLKPQAKVAIVYSNQQKGTGNTGLESKNPLLLTTMKKVSTFILSAVGDLLCSIICTIQNKL